MEDAGRELHDEQGRQLDRGSDIAGELLRVPVQPVRRRVVELALADLLLGEDGDERRQLVADTKGERCFEAVEITVFLRTEVDLQGLQLRPRQDPVEDRKSTRLNSSH